jgi:O-antigen/teichoic acid export membrane protein
MSALKTLFRQSSHYLMGRVGVFLIGLISFPLFTRLLSVSDYGLMSLVLKVVGVFAVLSKVGVQNSLLRFWDEHAVSREPDSLQRFFSTLFFGTAGTAVSATVLFALGVWVMPATLIAETTKQLLLLAAALIFIRGIFSLLAAFLRAEEKTKTYNVLDVAQKAGTIAVTCAIFFAWQRNVWAFIAGTVAVEGLVVLILTLFLVRRGRLVPKMFDAEVFRQAVLFGLPLIVYEFASVILDSGDRVLVQHYLGPIQLGYYSAAYNISAYLETALTVPLNLALFPIYIKVWVNKGKEETQAFLSRSLDLFLLLIVGVLVAVVSTSGDAVTVLASSKYQDAHRLLPILVAGLLVYSVHIFLSAGLLIFKKTFTAAKMVILACVVNVVMNVLMIPRMGLFAAALATLVSYAFLVVLLGWESFKVLPFRIEYGSLARYILAGVFTVALLRRLNLGNSLENLLAKGLLSLLLYAGGVWLIDPRVRTLFAKISATRREFAAGASGASLAEVASTSEE